MSARIPSDRAGAQGDAPARKRRDPAHDVAHSSPHEAADNAIAARLDEAVSYHKDLLFGPFFDMLAASDDLPAEMARIVRSLQVFFNKWTVEVILALSQAQATRFGQLRDQLAGISGRTLSQRLKELEDQGLVERRVHDERPVRIDYALTERGVDVAILAMPLVLYLRGAHRADA